ncbi:glutamine amidotransferase [Aureimonas sp. Leaf454]|uniref:type 1 glutamine amidotransferase n=1 Tax=Aureimonas sp. Leaf454 TaxID=1736381 RepID=UPI0006FCA139|nr:type 1 glutamine amidotransferase [Aureimonas sp. Leaf454]KQT54566.1 glutamine amidotransferase [Aureimonas sp. Leaf454]
MKILVAGSETPDERDARRDGAGASSAETYAETLRTLRPDAAIDIISCVEGDEPVNVWDLARYHAIVFPGSPLQMQDETPQTRRAARFMEAVYESGTPSFGSCAGLQIASVAAGGVCKRRQPRMEAAFARRITATEAGREHPLLSGRPAAWDAPAMHSSEITRLPPGATVLAGTQTTPVQAIEIRRANGIFWGVQYHPELTLAEIAASLRRQSGDLVEEGLAANETDVSDYAGRIDALDRAPDRRDLSWQLGLDEEVLDPRRRMREIRNFLDHVAERSGG